jgi:putative flippase GtrA
MTAPQMIAEAGKFIAYLAVGGVNTVFGYSAYAALLLTGVAPSIAVIGSTITGMAFNFASLGSLFGSRARHRLLRYVLTYGVLLGANLALLHIIMGIGIGPFLGQGVVVVILAPLSFLIMRRFVFAGVQ